MNRIVTFLRWLTFYLLVALMIGAFIWQEKLSISLTNHELIEIGLLLIFFFIASLWINHHEENFLVSNEWLEKNKETNINSNKVTNSLENKND